MESAVTSAKDYIENYLSNSEYSIEDSSLESDVILVFAGMFSNLRNNESLSEIKNPYLGTIKSFDDNHFIVAKRSSPMMAIQLEELIALNVKRIVYLGIAGSISSDVNIGDVVVSKGCINETGVGRIYGHEFKGLILADEFMTDDLYEKLSENSFTTHKEVHWCTDGLYRETLKKIEKFSSQGAVCVEMEAAALFSVASTYNIPCSAAFLISDKLTEGGWVQGWQDPLFLENLKRLPEIFVD